MKELEAIKKRLDDYQHHRIGSFNVYAPEDLRKLLAVAEVVRDTMTGIHCRCPHCQRQRDALAPLLEEEEGS